MIFGVDMSSSVHIDNKNKDILILGEGPTQGLHDTIESHWCEWFVISLSRIWRGKTWKTFY